MNITEQLAKALRKLVADIRGCWHLYEAYLRADLGNTNYSVIEDRITKAENALADYEASKATMGAGSIPAPSPEDDAGLTAACGSAPTTPAQGPDIEELTCIACETYEKSNPAHEIASWKGMRAALLAVQQKLREGDDV